MMYCKLVQVHYPVQLYWRCRKGTLTCTTSGYRYTTLYSCTAGVGQWREAGQLPSPRMTLRGAKVGEILHVTGGRDQDGLNDQVRVQVQVLVLAH